jgi:hypothetical protein
MYIYSNRRGLGDTAGDVLSSLSSTDTFTGLPVMWELGLGLLGAAFLMKFVGGKVGEKRRSYKRSTAQKAKVAARRAALQAELAAL